MQFFASSRLFLSVRSNISFSTLFSNTLNLCSHFIVRKTDGGCVTGAIPIFFFSSPSAYRRHVVILHLRVCTLNWSDPKLSAVAFYANL
jgi:hypothetical protein